MFQERRDSVVLLVDNHQDYAPPAARTARRPGSVQLADQQGEAAAVSGGLGDDPKEEDYSFFWFRHISATIVGPGTWKATDFTKGNVLKNSTSLLEGVPAYTNHLQWVGHEIGIVGSPEYQAATRRDGKNIPGGINAPFIIDKKLQPELVRKLKGLYGSSIDAVSVAVDFEWSPSHDFENDSDFYWHLGEMIKGEDGESTMVRRVAENILTYGESSMVWKGADPYAKKLSEDKSIVNPELYRTIEHGKFDAALYQQQKEAWYKEYIQKRKYYCFDSPDRRKTLILDTRMGVNTLQDKSFSNPSNALIMNEQDAIIAFVAAQIGVDAKELTLAMAKEKLGGGAPPAINGGGVSQEDFTALTNERDTLKASLDSTSSQLEQVTTERDSLQASITENQEFTEFGQKNLSAKRDQAKQLYTAFSKGNPNQLILDELDSCSLAHLEAKISMFGGDLYQAFNAHADENGKIRLKSSQQGNQEHQEDDQDAYIPFHEQMR